MKRNPNLDSHGNDNVEGYQPRVGDRGRSKGEGKGKLSSWEGCSLLSRVTDSFILRLCPHDPPLLRIRLRVGVSTRRTLTSQFEGMGVEPEAKNQHTARDILVNTQAFMCTCTYKQKSILKILDGKLMFFVLF